MMVECNVIISNCYEHINDLNSSLHFTWVIKYSKQLRFKIQTFTVHKYVWCTKIYRTIQAAQSLEINNGLKFCTMCFKVWNQLMHSHVKWWNFEWYRKVDQILDKPGFWRKFSTIKNENHKMLP